jgi:hypothetical protein
MRGSFGFRTGGSALAESFAQSLLSLFGPLHLGHQTILVYPPELPTSMIASRTGEDR